MARTRSQVSRSSDGTGFVARSAGSLERASLNSSGSTRPESDPTSAFTPPVPPQGPSHEMSSALERARTRTGRRQEDGNDFEDDGDDDDSMLYWGYTLVVGSTAALLWGTWSIVIGPHVEPTGWQILDALAQDTYYKYLVVLLVPVTTCCVIVNWWGLKIFRHA